MRTFVTGHNGLLGSSLMSSIPSGIETIVATRNELDLKNELEVSAFIRDNQVESVILAAAKVGGIFANSSAKHQFLLENLQIQSSVISACLRNSVTSLVFIGSSCVYSPDLVPPYNEQDIGRGSFEVTNEGYAIAKFTGIKLAQTISLERGWNYLSLIPCNLYGPFDNFDEFEAHVIPALIRKFVFAQQENKKSVEIMGNGLVRREFLYSDDLARAIWHFYDKDLDGKILNVGAGDEVSIRELAHLISDVVGYEGSTIFLNEGMNGVESKLMNSKRANMMGWQPRVSLKEGITRTVAWFRNLQEEVSK